MSVSSGSQTLLRGGGGGRYRVCGARLQTVFLCFFQCEMWVILTLLVVHVEGGGQGDDIPSRNPTDLNFQGETVIKAKTQCCLRQLQSEKSSEIQTQRYQATERPERCGDFARARLFQSEVMRSS